MYCFNWYGRAVCQVRGNREEGVIGGNLKREFEGAGQAWQEKVDQEDKDGGRGFQLERTMNKGIELGPACDLGQSNKI